MITVRQLRAEVKKQNAARDAAMKRSALLERQQFEADRDEARKTTLPKVLQKVEELIREAARTRRTELIFTF